MTVVGYIAVAVVGAGAVGALVVAVTSWPDIARYRRLRKM